MNDPLSDTGTALNPRVIRTREIPLDAVLVVGGFILVCVIELLSILVMNDGRFTYTLDDPYIHLAVAEEIAHGHYGVNVSEFSAPSSSPAWPLMLAPLARTPVAEYLPLVLNAGFGILSCLVVLRGVRRVFPITDSGEGMTHLLARAVICWVVLLGCNVPGIVFSGMEHSLQILLALLVVDGMIQFALTGKTGRLFLMAAACGPWVRYENLALTAAACGFLFWNKQPMRAIVAAGTAVAGVVLFSVFLVSVGLPPVPSSVLAKSHLAADSSHLVGILLALKKSFESDRGVLLLLMASVLV